MIANRARWKDGGATAARVHQLDRRVCSPDDVACLPAGSRIENEDLRNAYLNDGTLGGYIIIVGITMLVRWLYDGCTIIAKSTRILAMLVQWSYKHRYYLRALYKHCMSSRNAPEK